MKVLFAHLARGYWKKGWTPARLVASVDGFRVTCVGNGWSCQCPDPECDHLEAVAALVDPSMLKALEAEDDTAMRPARPSIPTPPKDGQLAQASRRRGGHRLSHCPAARYRVDATLFSVVAICKVPGCGARWLTHSRDSGLALLAVHVDLVHPCYENVPARRLRTAA